MAYITQAQLAERYTSLKFWTDDAGSGSVDAAIVAAFIALADAEVDSYAANHYSVPLTLSNAATAAVIRDKSLTIAGYKLATRLPGGSAPDNLRLAYEDAIDWLKQLAAGKVVLQGESLAAVPRPSGGIVVAGDDAAVTRTSMDGL